MLRWDFSFMYSIEDAKALIARSKFAEAGRVLDSLLAKDSENDELWYLRAVVSLKMKNYDSAHESLERASFIKRKAEYFKLKGVAYLQVYQLPDAITEFEKAIRMNKRDASTYFYLALCFMFLNDPRSRIMLQNAYLLDNKRTKELLKSFYEVFFKKDVTIDWKSKENLEAQMESISA
jgi:tetratricopeptide (TPR) repeat protein